MTEERRTSSTGAVLIVVGALLAAALLVALLVPVISCPVCHGTGEYAWVEGFPKAFCWSCKRSGRVTFYRRFVEPFFALEEPASPGKTPRP